MQPKDFEMLQHTADLKIRAYGSTIQELFKNSLKGMFSCIKPKGPYIRYETDKAGEEKLVCKKFTAQHNIHVRSESKEILLVDFLSDCLYLSDVHNEAYLDATFSLLEDTELQAIIYGTSITGFEVVEIKAVTYHDINFEQIEGLWQATIVFDI
jgi:SHS2 domain-containing protein